MEMERRGSIRRSCVLTQLRKQEDVLTKTKPFIIDKRRVLQAYRLVKANRGAAGVDQESIKDFEEDLKNNLYKIWNRLSSGSYFPPPVKAVSIPKKSGGERVLGIPTVSDRIAQMVIKLEFEPQVEPHFLADSYGYRPNKSALDAVGVTRKRCWQYNWVLEFDIKGLFDNIPHDLLMKAVHKHTDSPWVTLYIERWLTAPMQWADGHLEKRDKGTPQGGVISPVLANLFLHYAFDKWLVKHYSNVPWCRYADDGLVHCISENEAKRLLKDIKQRFETCGLTLHPDKTKIVYCKDANRKGEYENTAFDFLGYTFRPRLSKTRNGNTLFCSFSPAVSKVALKSMRFKIRKLGVRYRTDLNLIEIAAWLNPYIRGWLQYYGRYCPSAMYAMCRHVNKTLVRWAMWKFKGLRRHRIRASTFLQRIAAQNSNLFAHWKQMMVGVFV